jgi:hypothetical protein
LTDDAWAYRGCVILVVIASRALAVVLFGFFIDWAAEWGSSVGASGPDMLFLIGHGSFRPIR